MCFKNIQGIINADVKDGVAKLVLLVLNHHADKEKLICYPSLDTIAKETNLSKSTVIRKIDYLCKNKFIDRKQRSNKVNIYKIKDYRECQSDTSEVSERHHGRVRVTPEPTNHKPITYSEVQTNGIDSTRRFASHQGSRKINNSNTKRYNEQNSYHAKLNNLLRGKTQ